MRSVLVCGKLTIVNEIMKTEKALFKIVGMYCISRKPIVEKQSKNIQAVKKIDIDYIDR